MMSGFFTIGNDSSIAKLTERLPSIREVSPFHFAVLSCNSHLGTEEDKKIYISRPEAQISS